MDRREMLQWIGGAVGIHALAGVSPERLMAIGRAAHERRQALLVLNAHESETVTDHRRAHHSRNRHTRSQCGPLDDHCYRSAAPIAGP